MTRVHVVVEGQTEESFVNNVLAPVLWPADAYATAILIGPPGHRGGRVTFERVVDHLARLLPGDAGACCTKLLDFYGRGHGFPPISAGTTPGAAATLLERAISSELSKALPNHRVDLRCIPYFQLHEFEALLFGDPAAFAGAIGRTDLAAPLVAIRSGFQTPEDIDDGPASAPSKRVLALHPRYQKVLGGTQAARAVGLEAMRRECPRFGTWVARLEALAAA